ncbi:LysR family transcriptional regulator [Nonomuraea sp. KC401]|uniref:LysR family transcriptional regulator n=1 Tax=unclassified Nonomuraea TaxID=2593643 RepID=UPI0010FE5EB6|nr:LysR family transcriptional regulator [Nonomuraea sp. KC401]NBF00193.1 LysR family transcriptional regulator [Nonomuraea sp. K271]TLF52936.1 LysR family transcriptional regulator [Nonomuraea sp. KC401]
MEIRQLRYFIAVAEERNFTRAAARLTMTQPALSRAIRALERDVGAPLLVRAPGDVSLTPAGEILLGEARTLVSQAGHAMSRARRAAGTQDPLTVTGPGCDAWLLNELVHAYDETRPLMPGRVMVGNAGDQLDQLRSGAADLALLRGSIDDETLESVILLMEQVHVLLAASHPLAGREAIVMADLSDEQVVRWKEDNFRHVAAELWPDGPPGRPGPEVSDGMQMLAVVRLGQAVVLCTPRAAAATGSADVRAVRLSDGPSLPLRLAWLRDHSQVRSVRRFAHHSRAVCARQDGQAVRDLARWPPDHG